MEAPEDSSDEEISNSSRIGSLTALYTQASENAIHYSKVVATFRVAMLAATAAMAGALFQLNNSALKENIGFFIVLLGLLYLLGRFENIYGAHWDVCIDEAKRLEQALLVQSKLGIFIDEAEEQGLSVENQLGVCNTLGREFPTDYRKDNRIRTAMVIFVSLAITVGWKYSHLHGVPGVDEGRSGECIGKPKSGD